MPKRNLYILDLHAGRKYVGVTTDVNLRYALHAAGCAGEWTRRYPPLCVRHVSPVDEDQEKSLERLLTVQLIYKHGINRVRGSEVKKGGCYRPGDAQDVVALVRKALGVGEDAAAKRVALLFRREKDPEVVEEGTGDADDDINLLTDQAAILSLQDASGGEQTKGGIDPKGKWDAFDRQGRQLLDTNIAPGLSRYACCGQSRTCHPKSPFRCRRVASYQRSEDAYANHKIACNQQESPYAQHETLRNGHEREKRSPAPSHDNLYRSNRASSSREHGPTTSLEFHRMDRNGSSSLSRIQRHDLSSYDYGYPSSSKHSPPSDWMDANDSSDTISTGGGTQDGECGEPDFLEDDHFSHFGEFADQGNLSEDVIYSSDDENFHQEKVKSPPSASSEDGFFEHSGYGERYCAGYDVPGDSACVEIGESMGNNDFPFNNSAPDGDITSIKEEDELYLVDQFHNDGRHTVRRLYEARTGIREQEEKSEKIQNGKDNPNSASENKHSYSQENGFSYVTAGGSRDQNNGAGSNLDDIDDQVTNASHPKESPQGKHEGDYELFSDNEHYSEDERYSLDGSY